MCVGSWADITYLRYTALISLKNDETAVHCCDPALSVLVVLMSRIVFHVVSALESISFLHPRRHLRTPRIIQRKTGEERMQVFPVDCIAAKNLDLIACTPARYRRFSRKRSWEASKGTRARGLAGSASLPRALSLVQISSSSVREKRLFLPSYSLINSLRNARDSDLMQIEDAFKDPEDRFWEKNSSEGIVGNSEVQSNPAISNSVNSKSPLFRSNRSFPTP